jgi:uncharacterized protein with GYD domain
VTIYITTGRYTSQAISGMLAKPEDREAEVRGLIERAGGKLLGYYITFGDADWMIISENSSEVAVMSALVIGGASGAAFDMKTTVALTSAQAKEAFERAQSSAGQFMAAGRPRSDAPPENTTASGRSIHHMLANEG